MTEAEWLTATDPTTMLNFLRGKATDRKLRLYAAGLVRPHWHLLVEQRSREAVAVCERVADGIAPPDALHSAYRAAWDVVPLDSVSTAAQVGAARAAGRTVEASAWEAARYATNEVVELEAEAAEDAGSAADTETLYWRAKADALRRSAELLRDVFGNPFRAASPDRTLLPPAVVALARSLYAERAFHRTGELADALEQAGCGGDQGVIAHCREPVRHVPGCWVLDLVLGKT